jgi:enamine deaminase RidA (YjgF/YER057c/UK114 family)
MPLPSKLSVLVAIGLLTALSGCGRHRHITRVAVPNFPISASVTVPATATITYLSGMIAPIAHPEAPKDSVAAYGDTAEQVTAILEKTKTALAAQDLTMGDIISMQVFLVGDPNKGGKMDFAGLQSAYTKYFGTPDQPNKPVRVAVQVAGLVAPGALVEIQVTAARR